ncbi:hypothetical protein IJT17_03515 [bacterium]|nr:hypothetical protein [bacterium]
MRYDEIDLQVEDIMWFGVDTKGCIVEFTTGGSANVPEYVCRSREETEALEKYFTNMEQHTNANMLIDRNGSPLANDAFALASCGLFCYDVAYDKDHHPTSYYNKIAFPDKQLKITNLPDNIKRLICDHLISADAASDQLIQVDNAY